MTEWGVRDSAAFAKSSNMKEEKSVRQGLGWKTYSALAGDSMYMFMYLVSSAEEQSQGLCLLGVLYC